MKKRIIACFFACAAFFMYSCSQKPAGKETGALPVSNVEKSGDSSYTITFAGLKAGINYAQGGRLESFSLDGVEFLSGKAVNAGNWGNSLWPSPQSAWGWPPSKQLDVFGYAVVSDSAGVVLKSQRDSTLKYEFTKAYRINTADTSLIITYTIKNDSSAAQKAAAWEITRVAPNGLTFYPSGEEAKRGALAPLTKDSIGITWFAYDSSTIPSGVPKLLADGKEGWMAQVNNGYILIKKFPDVAKGAYAPEEGEIELYANPDHSYIEIEQQSQYIEIPSAGSIQYEVAWFLRKLPSDLSVEPGNQKLVDFVRSVIK